MSAREIHDAYEHRYRYYQIFLMRIADIIDFNDA